MIRYDRGQRVDPLVHPNEVVNLLIALIAVPMFLRLAKTKPKGEVTFFAAGYVALLGALVVTIAEGFVAPDAMNVLEHFLYSASGLLFLMAVVRLPKSVAPPGDSAT